MKLYANIKAIDIIGYGVVWIFLIIITFGVAIFFFPYSFAKFILNRTLVIDKNGASRQLNCNIDVFSQVGHIVLWSIISILTLGFGYFFYFFKVWNYSLNNTKVEGQGLAFSPQASLHFKGMDEVKSEKVMVEN